MDLREKISDAVYDHPGALAIIDAVMGVVEGDAEKRRAYTERCVEMARKAEAAIWETRVRELEDENQRMRDDLEAATVFRVGDVQVHKVTGSQATGSPGKWHVAISPASSRWVPSVSYDEDARDAALSPAREIAEEEA